MTTYRLDFVSTATGAKYSYPDGPFLPGLNVLFLTDDIIVHLGTMQPPAGVATFHMGQHVARLFSGGLQVGSDITVPRLIWNSEYGFDLTPDAALRTPQQIYDQGLMLPFGPQAPGKIPPPATNKYTGPGDYCGLSNAMGATGERPEIGLVTDASALYLFNGDFAPCCAMAKGLRPFGVFITDGRTGKPVDKILYPKASTYPNQIPSPSSPYYIAPAPATPSPTPSGWPLWDAAHTPEAAYKAFCITGQRRYLRILQYHANHADLWTIFKPFVDPFAPTVAISQTRNWAWGHRNQIYARRATELAESMGLDLNEYGLHPSSYFKKLSDNNIAFVRHFYMADPAIQVHRLWPFSVYQSLWQQDYIGEVLGLHAFLYPGEIDDLYLWDLGNLLPRVDGKSGFPPCIASSYRLNVSGTLPVNSNPNPFTLKASDFDSDWGASYQRLKDPSKFLAGEVHLTAADFAAADADQYNGDNWSLTDTYYKHLVLARLSTALYLDQYSPTLKGKVSAAWPELSQSYARQFKMLQNWMAKDPKNNIVPPRVSLLPNPPGSFPTPPTQPPTGVIIVSDPAFNAPFTATVSFKDNLGNPMTPDTVAWQGPAEFMVTKDPSNPLVAHGIYGKSGISSITAIGTKAGISVSVTKEVTVPEALPFLASGQIVLS